MRRRSRFLSEVWKGLVFIVTIRAIAKPYRSRRLYTAEDSAEEFDLASTANHA